MPPSSPPPPYSTVQTRALWTLAIALTFAAVLVFMPCSISLLIASWFALFARPGMTRLTKTLRGRAKAAAAITTLVVLGVVGPVVAATIPVVLSGIELATNLAKSSQWRDAAASLAENGAPFDPMTLIRQHLSSTWSAASMILRTSASAFFTIGIFVVSFFSFIKDGDELVLWIRRHTPLKEAHFDRLAAAYVETGRGLLMGVGVTALAQGLIATIVYAIVGIPRALPLGFLTTIGALVPGFGTALIWGPITAILGLGGYPGKALFVALSGIILIGSIDNFLKPLISNRAQLKVAPMLLFITMLSGLVAFGAAGLVLGPLFVRLALEILAILRDEQLLGERIEISKAR
ncbi:MAG: AI-2E family transporter [Polyangiaceae bacterium]|nr:AI-2E family transporter [Polyangiaceae bacterium]